ncbi:hypothetical protein LDENG_00166480 [Lucifuga dentata]|nr:hypothetical protein LDENG_00166480 [Lucifuga dentata]
MLLKSPEADLYRAKMKRTHARPGAPESKGKVKKRSEENSGLTISKKLSDKINEEMLKPGPSLKVQNRGGHGSILHYIYKSTLGQSLNSQMRQCLQEPFVHSLSSYCFHRAASPFDRRATCLEWHPTLPTTLAVGSKGGDLYLWDYNAPDKKTFIQGMGAGDSVTDMKFNQLNPTQLFTSSMGGTTALQDFNGTTLKVFASTDTVEPAFVFCAQKGAGDFIGGMKFCPADLSKIYLASGDGTLTMQSFEGSIRTILSRTQDCGHDYHNVCCWYCCVDVSISRQMLVTGDNMGQLFLLGLDGKKIFSDKLHKAKVSHAEFNSRCDWLLATASIDHTVKLWDLRKIKDKKSFLHDMPHDKAVNSAYFSSADCSKLLTTDQYDQIRVYSSCDWSKPQHIIQHPHRQFQHLSPIKATWHPVYDLIVVGRYPDDRVCPGDQRTIDIYDSNTAELVCQLQNPNVTGIKSINKFSPMGDVIGSAMGVAILVWTRDDSLISDQHKLQAETRTSEDRRRSQQHSSRNRRGPAMDPKVKKKLASLEASETKTRTKSRCTKTTSAQTGKKKK